MGKADVKAGMVRAVDQARRRPDLIQIIDNPDYRALGLVLIRVGGPDGAAVPMPMLLQDAPEEAMALYRQRLLATAQQRCGVCGAVGTVLGKVVEREDGGASGIGVMAHEVECPVGDSGGLEDWVHPRGLRIVRSASGTPSADDMIVSLLAECARVDAIAGMHGGFVTTSRIRQLLGGGDA